MNDTDFEHLWKNLVDRKYGRQKPPLNRSECLLYGLNLYAGGVPRSGMIGYFKNSTSNEIIDAKSALEILNLEEHIQILDKAQSILLGDRQLEPNEEQIQILNRDLSQEEYEEQSEQFENRIAPLEDDFEAMEDDLYDGIDKFIETQHITKTG